MTYPDNDPFADQRPGARATTRDRQAPRAEVIDDLDGLRTNNVPAVVQPPASEYGSLFASVPREPRDRERMLRAAQWVGSRMGEAAIYSWEVRGKRGKSLVEGPTIGLAYALAGEWGDTATRALLVERSPTKAKFRGEYIDLQRRTIVVREYVFALSPPPGKFAQGDQAQRWETMQEQSAASKAVRGAILAGLPGWLVDEAVKAAKESIRGAALRGQALPEALAGALKAFARVGVSEADIVALLDRPRDLWALGDLTRLRELWRQIDAGELSVDAAFADARAEAKAQARGRAAGGSAEDVAEQIGMGGKADTDPDPDDDAPDAELDAAREELLRLGKEYPDAIRAAGLTSLRGVRRMGAETVQEWLDKLDVVLNEQEAAAEKAGAATEQAEGPKE